MLSITPPKDLRSNLDWRAYVRGRGEKSLRARGQILERCKYEFDFWADSFAWQFNPNAANKVGPFIMRQRQSEIIIATEKRLFPKDDRNLRLDAILEKGREEGASWLACFLASRRSLFFNRERFIFVSHSADAVDKSGDPDSMFWKLDFIHDHLPEWMNPPRGDDRIKFRIAFPGTKSVITGQACSPKTSVGGRGVVILDEFGKQQWAELILSQTADVGPRWILSAHYGSGTCFHDQCKRPDVAKEQLHWTQNPEKSVGLYLSDPDLPTGYKILDKTYEFPPDYPFVISGRPLGGPFRGLRSPWYDAECLRPGRSVRDISSQLDINPEGSGHQFFDEGTIQSHIRKYTRHPVWEGDLIYNAVDGTPERLERKPGGLLKLWMNPRGHNIPPGRYAIACDIAAGTGATPSCICIGDADLGEKIGEYRNADIYPQDFALFFAALGKLFHDKDETEAFATWENAGGVGASFQKVFMQVYSNISYQTVPARFGAMRQENKKPGWYPRDDSVRSALETYRTSLAGGTFINPSRSALEECLKLVYVPGGKVKHASEETEDRDPTVGSVNHGDQARADMLCCMLMQGMGTMRVEKIQERGPTPGSFMWRFERGQAADRAAAEEWV